MCFWIDGNHKVVEFGMARRADDQHVANVIEAASFSAKLLQMVYFGVPLVTKARQLNDFFTNLALALISSFQPIPFCGVSNYPVDS